MNNRYIIEFSETLRQFLCDEVPDRSILDNDSRPRKQFVALLNKEL